MRTSLLLLVGAIARAVRHVVLPLSRGRDQWTEITRASDTDFCISGKQETWKSGKPERTNSGFRDPLPLGSQP